ncbi:hypothetical protein [Lutibacter sp. B1]|uniref:hypothetical protein n=1 Tax=Lutibacter sp. B1 TaxID=2725996 RepID=UPI0014567A9E|nr:hypothetical protein [Lutibacter sp. B1]NLP59338.1 hypothetical protein [Lutibacter sp. B1]
MKKINYILLGIIILGLFSCKTTNSTTENKTGKLTKENIERLTKYISNDSIFTNRLKNYFPDLKNSSELIFEPIKTIEFLSLSKYPKQTLTKTEFYKKYQNLTDLEFEKFINKRDSINEFSPYGLNFDNIDSEHNYETSKKILLRFSEKADNLINIEYIIVDEKVDERIVFHPRKGYYLIEFDNENNIIQRFYILRTVG